MARQRRRADATTIVGVQKILTGLVAAARELHFPTVPYLVDADENDEVKVVVIRMPVVVMGRRRFDAIHALVDIHDGRVYQVYFYDLANYSRPDNDNGIDGSGKHPHMTSTHMCTAPTIERVPGLLNRGDYLAGLGLLTEILGSSQHYRAGITICALCGADTRADKCGGCGRQVCDSCSRRCPICYQHRCKDCIGDTVAAGQPYVCPSHGEVVQCTACTNWREKAAMITCPSCQQERCSSSCTTRCRGCRQLVCRRCWDSGRYSVCIACADKRDAEQAKECIDPGCRRHGQRIPLNEFPAHSTASDGHTRRCRECTERAKEEQRQAEQAILEDMARQQAERRARYSGVALRLDTTTVSSTTTDIPF